MGLVRLAVVGIFFLSLNVQAKEVKSDLPYYAALSLDGNIKQSLFNILDSYHLPKGDEDLILPKCSQGGCFKHTPVSYTEARKYIFGYLHLEGNSPSTYQVSTYYCQETLNNANIGKSQLAPDKVPNNTIANVEHSWPQSKFTAKFPKNMQKADLHILFPEQSDINSMRGNFPFGEVQSPTKTPCLETALGKDSQGQTVFEPDDIVKGDMARAVFYYVTRYKVSLDATQEEALRKWHEMDPVSEKEIVRNEKIFEIQKDRNPFIDMPELVGLISDF